MSKKEYTKVRNNLEVKLAELVRANRRQELITERSNDPMDQIQSRIDLDMAGSPIEPVPAAGQHGPDAFPGAP